MIKCGVHGFATANQLFGLANLSDAATLSQELAEQGKEVYSGFNESLISVGEKKIIMRLSKLNYHHQ